MRGECRERVGRLRGGFEQLDVALAIDVNGGFSGCSAQRGGFFEAPSQLTIDVELVSGCVTRQDLDPRAYFRAPDEPGRLAQRRAARRRRASMQVRSPRIPQIRVIDPAVEHAFEVLLEPCADMVSMRINTGLALLASA